MKQRTAGASSTSSPQVFGGSGGNPYGAGGQVQTTGTGGAALANGGTPGSGGSTVTGGTVGAGGAGGTASTNRTGGALGSGGVVTGGRVGTGGIGGTAGTHRTGGAVGSGGSSSMGGTHATGGSSSVGGAVGSGGTFHTGGAVATGGLTGVGGMATHGGSLGSGGRLGSGGSAAGGTTTSGGATGTGGSCGDGILGPGEQCDLGVNNEASPAFWVTQSGQSFAAVPLMRSESGPTFYNYSSSSAHTGLEAVGASRVFLYLDMTALALSLVVIHGVDYDATGLDQPASQVVMQFSGLPSGTNVGLSDDPNELVMTPPTTATAIWNFTSNSDGGVLSVLPFPGAWEITIVPSFNFGISTWTWVQSDGSMVNLDLTQPLTIRAYDSPSPCRLDCTTPRCGDGILDGGEICDDGSQPATGCGIDCMVSN